MKKNIRKELYLIFTAAAILLFVCLLASSAVDEMIHIKWLVFGYLLAFTFAGAAFCLRCPEFIRGYVFATFATILAWIGYMFDWAPEIASDMYRRKQDQIDSWREFFDHTRIDYMKSIGKSFNSEDYYID